MSTGVAETHPEVFITPPAPPKVKKPGQLTPDQFNHFFEEGYVMLNDFFNKGTELDPVKEAIDVLVEDLAQKLYKAGKVKDLYKDYGFYQRLIKLEEDFPGANVLLHKYGRLPPAFRALWSNERLLNIVEQVLGSSDIVGHPVWNLRTKTPRNEATTVPWHQDVAYLDSDSYAVLQPTVWIPLLNSNANNGCMQMVRRTHRQGKVCTHQCCDGDTHYVTLQEEEIERALGADMKKDVVTCDVPYGGLVLFNNMIAHRSLNNQSDMTRWSLDLRWQRADKPVGFHGLKQGVRMRSSTQDKLDIDWEGFDNVDRAKAGAQSMGKKVADPFDTTIVGPWMKQWEIVHMNRHTAKLGEENAASWHAP